MMLNKIQPSTTSFKFSRHVSKAFAFAHTPGSSETSP